MHNFLEVLAGILLQPRETIVRLSREKNLSLALTIYSLVLFFSFAAQIVANGQDAAQLFLGLPFFLLLMWIFLFGLTAVFQLTAEFLGGKGRGLELFIGLALANTPYVFAAPAALLGRIDYPLAHALYGVVNLALWGWVLFLNVLAIKEVQGFSTVKSLLVMFMPMLLFIGGMLLLILMTVMILAVFGLENWANFQELFHNLN